MEANSSVRKFVVFRLDNEEYGIDILRVKEIKEMIGITRVPKAPYFVRGVMNLRGDVIPIVDLRKKFNLPEAKDTENSRIIIVTVDDLTVGLVIDSSSEVLEISNDLIEDAPSSIGSVEQSNIFGIGKVNNRLIILLDVVRILSNTAL
ncbi:MAG: chemotaxis protein CheW [Bacillota bacterium]